MPTEGNRKIWSSVRRQEEAPRGVRSDTRPANAEHAERMQVLKQLPLGTKIRRGCWLYYKVDSSRFSHLIFCKIYGKRHKGVVNFDACDGNYEILTGDPVDVCNPPLDTKANPPLWTKREAPRNPDRVSAALRGAVPQGVVVVNPRRANSAASPESARR